MPNRIERGWLSRLFGVHNNEKKDKTISKVSARLSDLARDLISDNHEIRDCAIILTREYAIEGNQEGLKGLKEAITYMYEGKDKISFYSPNHFLRVKPFEVEGSFKKLKNLAKKKLIWKTPPNKVQQLYSKALAFYSGQDILHEIMKIGDDNQTLAFQLLGTHLIVQGELNKHAPK